MAGDTPAPVKVGVVETLRASTSDDGTLEFTSPVEPGSEVRLVSGPFAQALGVVESLDGQGRIHVLLSLLGGNVRLQTSLNNVMAVP